MKSLFNETLNFSSERSGPPKFRNERALSTSRWSEHPVGVRFTKFSLQLHINSSTSASIYLFKVNSKH